MDVVDLIVECAKTPSFSTYEERLHPFVKGVLSEIKDINVVDIKDNNIAVFVGKNKHKKPVVITSHLDKINHYGLVYPKVLHTEVNSGRITGQMDNAVGVGICLNLIKEAQKRGFPPLVIVFSEMEESTGLKYHPHLLKNNGKDVSPQIGAARLSKYIDVNGIEPAAFITIDTSPVFKGDPGVALYTEHWEKTGVMPDKTLLEKIDQIRSFALSIDPEMRLANGTNDYMIYGKYFGIPEKGNVPSIAIEPAIFPYHQLNEGVFIEDVHRIVNLLNNMLCNFDFDL